MKAISEVLFRVYLALVSTVTIFILLTFTGQLIDIGLRTTLFPKANRPSYLPNCEYDVPKTIYDETLGEEKPLTEEERDAQCDRIIKREINNHQSTQAGKAVTALSFILITLPLFIVHFLVFYKDWKKSKKE